MENNKVVSKTDNSITTDLITVTEVDETPASISSLPTIFAGFAILAIFMIGVVVWCLYVPLGSSIQATGEVIFQGKRQAVQHLEGGIVKRILIKDGDLVKAGQPLIELERSQVQPLVHMLEDQGVAETVYTARLEAESKDLPQIVFPAQVMARKNDPALHKVIEAENRLFLAKKDAYNQQQELIRLQITQIREGNKGIQERLQAKKQEIATIKEQLVANQTLQSEGYISRTIILDMQRLLAERTGERESIAANLASEQQRIHELEQRITFMKAERIQAAVNELKQSTQKRIDLQERIRPVRDTLDRQVIRAPVTGKVVGLKVATIGGIIMPRDTLMEIAPSSDALMVEARVKVENINEVKVGKSAYVTIQGFDARTVPPLKAMVTYVSDDRINSAGAMGQPPYYSAYLSFDEAFIKSLGLNIQLIPGMSARVAIAATPRTPFGYLIAPILSHSRKAINAN